MKRSTAAGLLVASLFAVLVATGPRPLHKGARTAARLETERTAARIARRAEGYHKPDQPDGFQRYQAAIRRWDRPDSMGYAPAYATRALGAALALGKTSAALPWEEHGPGNVAGRARALVVDVRDAARNTWFMGTAGGGIWKTTNGGGAWTNVSPTLPNLAVSALAQAAAEPAVLYAGTGEGFGNLDAIFGSGVFKSADGGGSWALLPATATADFRAVNRLVVSADGRVVVAATTSGLVRTADGGETWARVQTDSDGFQQVIAAPDFGALYAVTEGACGSPSGGGVFRSVTGGATWTAASAGLTLPGGFGRAEIALSPTDPSRLYASVEGCDENSHVFVTADWGASWREVPPSDGRFERARFLGGQGWYDNTIAVHPADPNVVYVGGVSLWRLAVTGATTTAPTYGYRQITNWYTGSGLPYVHADAHSLTFLPGGGGTFRTIATTDGGAFESADGGASWAPRNGGLNTTQFYGVDKQPGATRFVAGTQDNGSWTSPSAPGPTAAWTGVLGGDGFDAVYHGTDPARYLVSLYYNGIHRAEGGTVNPSVAGLGDRESGVAPFVTTIAKSAADPELVFVGGASGVWRSDDFATTWAVGDLRGRTSTNGATDFWGFNGARVQVAVSDADTRVVWAGTRMSTRGSVFVSRDGGASFDRTANAPGAAALLSGFATHPTERATGYALFSAPAHAKVLRTRDFGATWTSLSGTFSAGAALSSNGFPNVAVNSLLVLPYDPNVLWAGTEIGLFVSNDGGGSWAKDASGLPAVSIWKLRVAEGRVVVATHGRGVWSVVLPELAGRTVAQAVRAPILYGASGGPQGGLSTDGVLRQAMDSVRVEVDGAVVWRAGARAGGTRINPTAAVTSGTFRTARVQIIGFVGGEPYASVPRYAAVFPAAEPVLRYATDFSGGADADFYMSGAFAVGPSAGFSSPVLQSAHPYGDAASTWAMLARPIRVAASGAVIRYRDVAIVEPGEPGSRFGQDSFYDYVVVEGTKDGVNWKPLADGYNARDTAPWLAAFNAKAAGTEALFVAREVPLTPAFAAGDVVFVRFRLFADTNVNGWGWAVDDLAVQPNATANEPAAAAAARAALGAPYPNPFGARTTIPFALAHAGPVAVRVYDARGRLVATLAEGVRPAGEHRAAFDAAGLASGVYVVRLEAPGVRLARTVTLVR